MFEQLTSPDQPNQAYAELVRIRGQERLARGLLRERKSQRRLDRRAAEPQPDDLRPSPHVELSCCPGQA